MPHAIQNADLGLECLQPEGHHVHVRVYPDENGAPVLHAWGIRDEMVFMSRADVRQLMEMLGLYAEVS
jgi:hypothetical protein